MPQMEFTDQGVRALLRRYDQDPNRAREVQYFERLEEGRSLVLYISYGGARTWRVLYYENGKPRTKAIGSYPELSIKDARKAARRFNAVGAIAATKAGTFKEVADDWVVRYVEKEGLRTAYEIKRQLKTIIYPPWPKKPIFEIDRDDVNALLDKIEDESGAAMADYVLSTIRSIMTWYAVRNGKYNSPIVPKMQRGKKVKRDRILDEDEVRAIWDACGELGIYGAMVKVLLLTAQRLDKVAKLRWDDIANGVKFRDEQKRPQLANNVWVVRTEDGEKDNIGAVQLPNQVLDILNTLPRIEGNPWVFPAARGRGSIKSFSRGKKQLDRDLKKVVKGMPAWRLHDLRRTARTLMAEIGIADNVAERTLGHAIPGIEGIYNRFSYFNQKSETLRRLADHILPPDGTNVVALRPHVDA